MSTWVGQEPQVNIGSRVFQASEITLAIEELRSNPEWLRDLTNFYTRSHRGLGHWIYLSLLAAISSSITHPIDYVGSPIRSKIHLLLKGQTGGGKGFIMGVIEDLFPKVEIQGVATGPAILGGISGGTSREGGRWIPGKAYHARHGVLLIRELFQSLRTGEFYSDISNDMNEILEYPHKVQKSVISGRMSSEGISEAQRDFGDVVFPRPNEFSYEAPCVVIAGVPELSLNTLLTRVSEGFMSRFVDVPIGYTKSEALDGLKTFWDNVLLPSGDNGEGNILRYRRMCSVMHAANMGWLGNRMPELRNIILPGNIRELLQQETMRALESCWNRLTGPDASGNPFLQRQAPPPILFRESGDVLRIAVADAVSRRFTETERPHNPGIVQIDEKAATTALEYLNVIAETRTQMFLEAMKVQRFRVPTKPAISGVAYDLIRRSDISGIHTETLIEIMALEYHFSRQEAIHQIQGLLHQPHPVIEQTADGRLVSVVVSRLNQQRRGLFGLDVVVR